METEMIFDNVDFRPSFDGDYFENVLQVIRSAHLRCYSSMFIVDYALDDQAEFRIDHILLEMSSANWRGVDTKLIIGGSRTNSRILSLSLIHI